MSSSLVRKALELVEAETADDCTQSSKRRKNEQKKKLKSDQKSCQGQRTRVLVDTRSEAARQIELARKISSSSKDRTSENLKTLLARSKTKSVDFVRAQKILDQTVKRKKPLDDTDPENSASKFTEEDFRKFEEEYFVK